MITFVGLICAIVLGTAYAAFADWLDMSPWIYWPSAILMALILGNKARAAQQAEKEEKSG